MMNILIYPQRIKITATNPQLIKNQAQGDSASKEQQEKVRDFIQYLKAAKQILATSSS